MRGLKELPIQQTPIRGSRMDKAVTYIQNRRSYLDDGRCSFSNNLSENPRLK